MPEQGGQWPDLSWAESVGGVPLQVLINEALADNPGLQVAAARVAAARALAQAASAAARPTVGAAFSSTYQRYSENYIFPPPLAGQFESDNQLTLNFSYDFDFWGKHAADLRAALSEGKAAEAEEYASHLVLTTAIARAWIQLASQYAQSDLTEQQLKLWQKIDHLTQLRLAAGLDTQTENQQARQQLAGLHAEQAQWQEAIELTRNQLGALSGQGPDRGQRIARPSMPPQAATVLPDALPLSLLGRRPDIVAARWRVEAAQGDIDRAKTQFYPNVNLIAFAGFSSLGLSNLLQAGSRTVGIGPAIRLPVFEGGSLQAQLKSKVAAYDAAVAAYNQVLTESLHEVADQVQSLRAAEIQNGHHVIATQAAAANLKLAQQRERVGTSNMLPVLSSEMAWLMQRKVELNGQARRTELRISLIKALGGGFDASTRGLEPVSIDNPRNISKSAS
jgi:NodT family efflux transporter outer membrane factor (OMF) lipoprotein